jgi:hypothetical protein
MESAIAPVTNARDIRKTAVGGSLAAHLIEPVQVKTSKVVHKDQKWRRCFDTSTTSSFRAVLK